MDDARSSSAPGPLLVVVAGLVASGKSTLSRSLAARLGAARFEADRVRGILLQAAEADGFGPEARWRRALSDDFEGAVYDDLLERAGEALDAGRPVVLDGCFPRQSQRETARRLAHARGAPFLYVECRVSEEAAARRLAAREREGNEGWFEIYRRLAARVEPAESLPGAERIAVSGEAPVEATLDAVFERLGRSLPGLERLPPAAIAPLPRAVSFDCWGTLIVEQDWPWAHRLRVQALLDAADEAGARVDVDEARRAFDTAWRRHQIHWEKSLATGAREVATWALAEIGLHEAHPALEHLVRRFEEASHTGRVVALPGARELLASLEAAGVHRVLVCDTGLTPGRVVRRLLDHAGLLEGLEVQAFSDEVGATKPDRRPFLHALEGVGVAPEQAVHVGDLRRTDVAGARGLGMRSVRIRAYHDDASEHPEADHVVDSHEALARQLGLRLPDFPD